MQPPPPPPPKKMTLFNNLSPLSHRSAILEANCARCSMSAALHCDQWTLSKMALRWRRWDELLNEVFICFCFFSVQEVFLSLRYIQIEPLMADGQFWWCFSYFSGPWQYHLLGSQWDSHKPPSFHPKYLKLCSETNKAFTGLEQLLGKWLMTKF